MENMGFFNCVMHDAQVHECFNYNMIIGSNNQKCIISDPFNKVYVFFYCICTDM